MNDKQESQPQDLNCEQALLCSMMKFEKPRLQALEWGIRLDDFLDPRNKELFCVIRSMHDMGTPCDLVVISDTFRKMQMQLLTDAYIAEIWGVTDSGAVWKYYCEILREATIKRTLREAALKLQLLCNTKGSSIDDIRSEALPLLQEFLKQEERPLGIATYINDLADEFESMVRPERFSTGVYDLDHAIGGGVSRGEMMVVAGETSRGKSVLLLMAALEAIQAGKKCAVFSLEMTPVSVLKRMACNYTGTALKSLADYPTPQEKDDAAKALSFLRSKSDILSMPRHSDVLQMEAFCKSNRPDLIVVDYIQLVQCRDGDNREQQVSSISRRLKNLAGECGSALITASQLNDDGKLRESRTIGQHADQVIVIRNEPNSLVIDKNRRGPSGQVINVTLKGDISRFE